MDRRVIKTRSKVKNGVLKIYGQEPLENYPIAFLCKEIGLNRTTFYIHYSCIDDVVEEIASETIAEIKQLILPHLDNPQAIAETLVKYITEHKKVSKLIVNESKCKWINETIDTIKDLMLETPYLKSIYDKTRKEYTISFAIYGCYGVLSKWINEDFREDKFLVIRKLVKYLRTGE